MAPWRDLLAVCVIALGVGLAVTRWSRRPIFATSRPRALAIGYLGLGAITLTRLGAAPDSATWYPRESRRPNLSDT